LLLDAKRAASLCGVSRATWFSWQASGAIPLPALRRGRVVRWSARELTAWIEKGCPARDRWTAMKGAAR
jgi:predicted DNA-binding transcriptional regulator AlpA